MTIPRRARPKPTKNLWHQHACGGSLQAPNPKTSPRAHAEQDKMATYEYICKECNKSFSVTQTLKEHETKKATCPKCGSRKAEQKISTFFAITSRKA